MSFTVYVIWRRGSWWGIWGRESSSVRIVALWRLLLGAGLLFDCLVLVPSSDSSSRRCITGKQQPGRDSLTSLLGQTGVFFNHSPKASGNPGFFPRSAGISPALWCCCRHPVETLVKRVSECWLAAVLGFLGKTSVRMICVGEIGPKRKTVSC